MKVGDKEIRLELVPLSSLRPHEETEDALLSEVVSQIRTEGIQRDPIIIDSKSQVVLDGMHRLKALEILGALDAVCHGITYDNSSVKVLRWLRSASRCGGEKAKRILRELGLKKRVTAKEAAELVEIGQSPLAVLKGGSGFLPAYPAGRSSDKSRSVVRRFDSLCRELNVTQEFIDEDQLAEALTDPTIVVLLTPRITKDEVISAALESMPLPHKTTRHILPIRPLGVNFPLEDLIEGRRVERLSQIVSKARVRVIEPPASYRGRVYRERLAVMD